MVGNNVGAMELYKRHGYKVVEIKSSSNKKILTLLPSNTKIALLKSHD
jgi:ribosomal protein S18 acetylase RimI-like enzyme